MDNYTRMKMSEKMDEDAVEYIDYDTEELLDKGSSAEEFKKKYKEFYTDIKLTIKEDW